MVIDIKTETGRHGAITLIILRARTILLIALVIFSAVIVSAIPPTPHRFYGDVILGGTTAAPDGTVIEAKIGGVTYTETRTSESLYGWGEPPFQVPGDDPDTSEVEGGVNGDLVEFYVDGEWAANYTFESGTITELSLDPRARFCHLDPVASINNRARLRSVK